MDNSGSFPFLLDKGSFPSFNWTYLLRIGRKMEFSSESPDGRGARYRSIPASLAGVPNVQL